MSPWFLSKPGRTSERAVKSFQPRAEINQRYPEGRKALVYLLQSASSGHRLVSVEPRSMRHWAKRLGVFPGGRCDFILSFFPQAVARKNELLLATNPKQFLP